MKKRNIILSILMAISLLAISTGTSVLAYDSEDDNTIEVGVYWVNDYENLYPLTQPDDDATGFEDVLEGEGWDDAINQGNYSVTESDFEGNYGVETVDLGYFSGHGGTGFFNLIYDPYPVDRVYGENCTWGDNDLEWIMLQACNTLNDDDAASGEKADGEFAQALNGIRIICGAETVMIKDDYAGSDVAGYLVDNDGGGPDIAYMVVDSWFLGSDIAQDSTITIRAIGETYGILDQDYIWGQASGPWYMAYTVDAYYYSFTYNCED